MSIAVCVISYSDPDGSVMADGADYNNQTSFPHLSPVCFPHLSHARTSYITRSRRDAATGCST